MKKVLTKVFGDPQVRTVKRLTKRVAVINDLAKKYKSMNDSELKKQTAVLKERLAKKKTTLEDVLPDAFALVREAADRKVGMRHFDVQLVGGMALHEGNVAEMKTGEGKTLVATLPTYLNALTEKGVHVVTVNDYLAQRDAGWMGAVYYALGMSTGIIIAERSYMFDPKYDNDEHEDPRMRKLRPCTRKEAYAADITYGTNNEFGFDYLRDNMVNDVELLRQRELNFAIVDEVDSILIDEARTPLIISAPAAESPELYQKFSKMAAKLKPEDYILDEKRKSVSLSEQGVDKIQKMLGVNNLYSPEHVRSVYHMDQALRAQTLFRKDKEYVISKDNEIIIVDEFTGRLMHGRRYNEGLHQAIEAKENVPVLQESMTLATVSFQNFFRMYDKLSGMTGTAFTEAEEFQQIYSLDVVQIPSNKPMIREDKMDMIFKTEAGKLKALVRDVAEHRKQGRPVLIGSASITKNELISRELTKAGIPHSLLNAKNNEHEASIIANAGQKGAVTLATNIAGRGTDIVLAEGVRELGGLVVLGSERHEARRIDNQLRGRGGRQGDPGISQFYVSTEDDLMRIFQGERIASLMDRLGVEEDMPIQNRSVSKTLEAAQKRVEGYHYDARKNVVQYDNVINRHRKAVYRIRRQILESEDNKEEVEKLVNDKVEELASTAIDAQLEFKEQLETVFRLDKKTIQKLADEKRESVRRSALVKAAAKRYKEQEEALTPEITRKIEREIYLQVLDTLWMQHLENMQHLREGIHWRSVGQRDPLVEYRRESQHLFDSMQLTLRDEIVRTVFSVTRADITPAAIDESFDTELTRAAEKSVEQGVNEVTMTSQGAEFAPKRSATSPKKTKSAVQKSRKKQRKNKKKARRH